MAPSTCTRCLHSHAQSRGGRPSAAAAQPSDSRALPSLASQARGCSPCACSHRRARLAAGRHTRAESGLGVGSCPRLALRAAWSPSSSPSCALRADRARAAGATPHASQFCSREPPPPPLVCPLRGAPLGLAAPPPPCTLAHASASASADRLSWATSRLQLGSNLDQGKQPVEPGARETGARGTIESKGERSLCIRIV